MAKWGNPSFKTKDAPPKKPKKDKDAIPPVQVKAKVSVKIGGVKKKGVKGGKT